MFAYCENNPVNTIDPLGLFAIRTSYEAVYFDHANMHQSTNPKDSPPDHPDFVPPKKGNKKVKNPNGKGYGWVDQKGNVWIWTPGMHGGDGWIIQHPNGDHRHAYPGGGIRNHFESTSGNSMVISFPAYPQNQALEYLPYIIPVVIVFGLAAGVAQIEYESGK